MLLDYLLGSFGFDKITVMKRIKKCFGLRIFFPAVKRRMERCILL